MRRLVVLMMLGSLVSGCADLGGGPDLMTAKQAIGPADRAAARWADDAVLLNANANEFDDEARREAADEFADEKEELKEALDDGDITQAEYDNITEFYDAIDAVLDIHDGDVGDGRASMWGFTYYSESEQDGYMVAIMHGEVVYRKSIQALWGDDFGIEDFIEDEVGTWDVDSDEAADVASLDEDYQRICGGSNVLSFMSLVAGETGPVWSMGAMTQSGDDEDDDFAFLAVDAINGSLIVDDSVVLDPVQDILFQESGVADGQFVAAVQTSQTSAFEVVSDQHVVMSLHARVQPPPVQPVTITVTDPTGRETTLTIERGEAPFVALADAQVDTAPQGTYTVEAVTPLSVRDDWSLYWCTDGMPVDQDDVENPACVAINEGSGTGASARAAALPETLSFIGAWLQPW